VIQLSEVELRRADQLIAIHLFGYRWFFFPQQQATTSIPATDSRYRPYVPASCSLQMPGEWLKRYNARQVDHPTPGDELDIDIPAYHKNPELLATLMEKCTEHDPEHPLQLWFCQDEKSYCFGDIQKPHYPTIQIALCAYIIRLFQLEGCPTWLPDGKL
jgi:hypothetical protein